MDGSTGGWGTLIFFGVEPLRLRSGAGLGCTNAIMGKPTWKCPPRFLGSLVLFQGLVILLSEYGATF